MTSFASRHIGTDAAAQEHMLAAVGAGSISGLLERAVPGSIRHEGVPAGLPAAAGEPEVLARLRAYAARNTVRTSMIGQGYYDTFTPPVIQRNVLENPSWYTAYTPYQPEISQGRLEALLNFQTMVIDLTGLAVAGASMLDEGTAAAEAMLLARRVSKGAGHRFVVDRDTFAQTLAVLATRAEPVGIELVVADLTDGLAGTDLTDVFGVLVQVPGASGRVPSRAVLEGITAAAHDAGALAVVAADLLAATLVAGPGEYGADVAVGTTQRFGVPMGFGGPHAGYLAVRAGLERQLPGRLVGVSKDAAGAPALRLALQTREQHIRREKATSNICTAQVLLAVMASMYAVYHGPDGLREIAATVHARAVELAGALRAGGVRLSHQHFFDTLELAVPGRAQDVAAAALARNITVFVAGADHVRVSTDELTTPDVVAELADAVLTTLGPDATAATGAPPAPSDPAPGAPVDTRPGTAPATALPEDLLRTSEYLTHPVFHAHRSETAMMRYLRRLADKDYALDRGMIPLGSCTMKLNAAVEMQAITWPEFARIHPFAPAADVAGYLDLVHELEGWLAAATGYDAVSLQPNAGSQGELSGLLAIRGYHASRGEEHRDVCLIPASAHGTNAASAVLAGLRVVVVATDAQGDVDLDDLRRLAAEHADRLAAIMLTYPSTHGVYEERVREVCAAVHDAGGQVYVDGANLNALLGHALPGEFGGDVSHLNLHKTFCIPHGGGGPGVGPVAARAHLAPFLPGHPLAPDAGARRLRTEGAVSSAPYGSPSILPISWAYIALMGGEGLRAATDAAVLAANYVAARLGEHYPVLYRGRHGLVAHECILDLRPLRAATGITVDDVAKRLIDYGFHAPTMSFPVAGTLMVEPTESEDLGEIDRFCEAMVAIAAEAARVGSGDWPREDNPLVGAPHTAEALVGEWEHPYTRAEAVFPVPGLVDGKYWPPVRRVDGAYGDRHLVCACPPVEAFGAVS
ncbi:aminomethyl-transferring glycine dehydrogenase [Georgenia thermotolerans]|uniref:Glycine dehydrogenase (decarboxylating) n=1 Tax=Georgenia thermotolerans TaxID=527326 RepID=A0A7J5UP97_9MICO|nr:aminomethyl-transferring glycine dehydrogenase [Georgenia thermotolerans]KAE8764189.1 aminomethyl-transferring glycine dehydrogenase [Georgenia thermotolerans]